MGNLFGTCNKKDVDVMATKTGQTERNSCSPSAKRTLQEESTLSNVCADSKRKLCTLTIPADFVNETMDWDQMKRDFSADSLQSNLIQFKMSFEQIQPLVKLLSKTFKKKTRTMTKNPSRKLNKPEFKAFRSLIGENFCNLYRVENDVIYVIDSPNKLEAENKLNNFRHDEMALDSSVMNQLLPSFDETSFLPNAFAILVPKKRKVIIFGLDFLAMATAKHQIQIKCGMKKVTEGKHAAKRDKVTSVNKNGHITENTKSGRDVLEASTVKTPKSIKDFTTNSGIQVSVYKADITQLTVDAIVNAANKRLQHAGGVAAAIAKAAGVKMEIEGDDYVRKCGPLNVTDVLPTTAGKLPCGTVLHAVGPRWDDYVDKDRCQQDLEQTVFKCLLKAQELNIQTMAISSISSAIFGVPKELCAKMYLAALQRFEKTFGSETSIQHIHFVDISENMVDIIHNTFSQNWNTDITPPPGDKQLGRTSQSVSVADDLSTPVDILHQSSECKVLDANFTLHVDKEDIPIDVIVLCNVQKVSLECKSGNTDICTSIAGELFSCLDLQKIRQNLGGKYLQTFTTDKGMLLLFPPMSRDQISIENARDIIEQVTSKMDEGYTRTPNILAIPYKREVSETNTRLLPRDSTLGIFTTLTLKAETKMSNVEVYKVNTDGNSHQVIAETLHVRAQNEPNFNDRGVQPHDVVEISYGYLSEFKTANRNKSTTRSLVGSQSINEQVLQERVGNGFYGDTKF